MKKVLSLFLAVCISFSCLVPGVFAADEEGCQNHSLEFAKTIMPTCQNLGYDLYRCNSCGEESRDNYKAKVGCDMQPYTQAPTCIENGYTTMRCIYCGVTEPWTDVVDPLGHNFVYEKVEATCTDWGYEREICDRCGGYNYNNNLEPSHDMVIEEVPATCTEPGYHKEYCTKCDYGYCDEFGPIGHHYTENTVAPTYEEGGYTETVCQNCGDRTVSNETEPFKVWQYTITDNEAYITGYTGNAAELKVPQSLNGYPVVSIEGIVNNENLTSVYLPDSLRILGKDVFEGCLNLLNIEFGNNIIKISTSLEGTAYYNITNNWTNSELYGGFRNRYVFASTATSFATAMIYTVVVADGAYYTLTDGATLILPSTVTYIGDNIVDFSKDITIKCHHTSSAEAYATEHSLKISYSDPYCQEDGHNFSDWNVHYYGSCTEDTIEYRSCSVCDFYEFRNVAAPGHDFSEEIVEATCHNEGYTRYNCNNCPYCYEDNFVAPLEHDYQLIDACDPGCYDMGYANYNCSLCGEFKQETLAPLGHNITENIIPPSCYNDGYTEKRCDRCGFYETTDFVRFLGHDYDEVVVEPNCPEVGYTEYTCKRCGQYYRDNYVNPEHKFEFVETVAPTEYETGYDLYACNCGMTEYRNEVPPLSDYYVSFEEHFGGAAAIMGYYGEEKDLVIPDEINGYPVEYIMGIEGNSNLESVVIPESVKYINSVFNDCENLKDITIENPSAIVSFSFMGTKFYNTQANWENGLLYIGTILVATDETISGDIVIPDGTTSIGAGLFLFEENITSIVVPASLKVVSYSFTDNPNLKSITVLSRDVEFKEYAFGYNGDITADDYVLYCYKDSTVAAFAKENLINASYIDAEPCDEHSFLEWSEFIPARCTEKGYDKRVCDVCGKIETREIGYGDHFMGWSNTMPANCNHEGYTENYCMYCDYVSITDVTPALGHDKQLMESQAPTCNNNGYESYSCMRCGEWFYEYSDALGHNFVVTNETPSTCTEQGFIEQTCSRCNEQIMQWKDFIPHDYEEVYTAPTCDMYGRLENVCKMCGSASFIEEYPPLEHDLVVEDVDSTCTQNGYHKETCTRCDYLYYYEYISSGHNYGSNEIPPTCTEQGYVEFTCFNCGDTYRSNYVDPISHNYIETIYEPTCTNEGYSYKYCSNCGDEEYYNYVDALGHLHESEGSLTVYEPDCLNSGYTYFICDRCGDSWSGDFADPLGHLYESEGSIIVTEPTCTQQGYSFYTCDRCGSQHQDNYTDMIEHDYSVFVEKVEPQVGFAGYTIYKCSRCEKTENRDFVAALPDYGGSEIPTDRVNNVKLTTTDTQMTLTWDAFKDATRYWIKYNKVGETKKETIKTTATSLTITYKTLDYHTEYEFMVYAQVGSKVQTKADMVSGKFTLKDRAVNHKITYEGKAAILNFDIPENSSTKAKYAIVFNKDTNQRVTTVAIKNGLTTARLVNDLVPGIPYYAVVSLYIAEDKAYMPIDQCIPIDFTIPLTEIVEINYKENEETPTSVRINWASATSKIYYYFVAIYEKETNTRLTTKQTKQTYTAFTGLKPNTEYEITIQASVQYKLNDGRVETKYYKGPNGDGVLPRVSYKTPDYSYVEPTVVAEGNNVTVSWDAAEAATSYYIYEQTATGRKLVKSVGKSVTSYTFEAEAGKHTYGVAVCIKNYAGTSYAPVTWAEAIVVK